MVESGGSRSRPIDLESTQNNALVKLPLLKQGDYDTWRVQNYALWEIIEEGNSFKPVARTTTNANGTSTSTIPGAVTAKEKIQKKNDLNARSILMMPLPSEHLLTLNQYKDAKTLFEAIEARFYGNEATKKTQKTLLKQMYENFNASSSESLDSIFTRLQKIRNKSDLGSISFDDLYNNFKIVEQEVKRSVTSSSNSNSQNVAFVSTPSSTNDVNTSNVLVKFASSSLSIASSTDNTARLSDATIYAFLDNQPNGSQRTRKKIIINGSDTAGYDKKKVECFNCHKMGHFVRECRNLRSQENRSRNQDSSRRTMNVEESSSKAMLAIDEAGVDWSYMTEEEVPTNFALIAFSDSELNKSKSDLANYKRGLASVEEQLVFYKKNEERLKKEKESNQIKIDNFENASKSLDKLIGSQISYNNRNGVGYNVVKKNVSENSSNEIKKTSGAPIIEDWVSDSNEDENIEKVSESANVQKPKQADQPRKVSQNPRNNSTNWNTSMSKKIRMVQKPGLNNVKKGTGQREVRPVWNNAMRTNHQNFSNSRRNFAPTTVLTKSGLVPISTARQSSSRTTATVSTARPIKTVTPKPFVNVAKTRPNAFQKSHSPSRRAFYQQTALQNINLNNKVNTVNVNFVNAAK
ncbi:ribonuclease H-like domain-containing protein [Tanacetum coccineum]